MRHQHYGLYLAVIFLVLSWTTPTTGQTSAPLNYGFVSPNTRDDLKIEQAIKRMESVEEKKMILSAANLGCVVRTKIRAFKALGSWSDGAENSVMLRMKSDEDSLRYVLARMGRDAKQKSVLYFHPQANGTALIYRLEPRSGTRNLQRLASSLDRIGIKFRTLVPTNNNTWIYLVDLSNELREKVRVAARRLRARVSVEKGTASFIGADQAEQSKEIFTQAISNYEAKHPNLPPTCDVKKTRRPL